MWWLIVLGLLVLLAFLPVGFKARYDERGPVAWLFVGPVKFRVYPQDKSDKKADKKAETSERKEGQSIGGKLKLFLPLLQDVLEMLSEIRRKLRISNLECKLTMAGDDPCDLAVSYGKAWAVLGNLIPHIERLFIIKKRDLSVECDFTADETTINFKVSGWLTLASLIAIIAVHGTKIYYKYQSIRNQRKGGAKV